MVEVCPTSVKTVIHFIIATYQIDNQLISQCLGAAAAGLTGEWGAQRLSA